MEVPKRMKTEEAGPEKEVKERVHYDELKRENALFSLYYTLQEIVPSDEFPLLLSTLGQSLPLTFRLTGHRSDAKVIKQKLENELLPTLGAGAKILEWYSPKGYAFQLETDRKTMRTNEEYKSFHKWLVAATENGDISRQEAVSMIPPLFLDVQNDHMVLDMCAAPGSKTAQLIEALHSCSGDEPSGTVVANDSDKQRAFMLYHQVKRILSPCLLVTNNDGTLFPTLIGQSEEDQQPTRMLFDRILADVPCSGDGTLRKNATLWSTWTPNHALGLHPLQIRLLDKAVKLLKVGGRIVYSTCSMNFVENEAVVAYILDRYPHALELVDVSAMAPELKRYPGKDSWKVVSKEGTVFETFDAVPENQRKRFPQSLFPKDSYKSLNLDRCVRIYPHLQNTGGFFIAVIQKKDELVSRNEKETIEETESVEVKQKTKSVNKGYQYRRGMKPEDEFRCLNVASDPTLNQIFDWYGIDTSAMLKAGYGFLVRSERDPIRVITVVSPKLAPIMKATVVAHRKGAEEEQNLFNRSMKIVNAGVRAFELYESSRPIPVQCAYRPLAESIDVIRPFITKRIMKVSNEDITNLLNSQNSIEMTNVSELLGEGGAVLETETATGVMSIPVWISERGIKAFVPSANRPAMLLKLEPMKN